MKRLLISLWLVASFAVAGADSKKIVVEDASSAAIVTNSPSYKFYGILDSVHIDVTAPATQTVVIATATDTLLTATAVTADTTYRVRYPAVDSAGATVAGTTNIQHMLVGEPITVTVTSTQTNALDCGVTIKFDNLKY